MTQIKRRLISLLTLAFILVIGWMVFKRTNRQPITYGDYGVNIPQSYPILGIDVSHYQENISWSYVSNMKVHDDSVQFAFIKATEGNKFVDEKFVRNSNAASLERIEYGFYHYYDPALSAKKQADFFSSTIRDYNFTLRPVIDIEISGDLKTYEVVDSIITFLDEVESLLGHRPIVYTYENFFLENIDQLRMREEYFWIASYNRHCKLMDEINVLIWQFSESGTVDGIENAVDLNIAKEGFFNLCKIKME
ncbi:hypothetical protein JYT74_01080 [Crocinitomix catalasitica]|nr:hypothetical protein [Crocinitomix catalasitica]